jgi:hypothetical protein
MVDEKPEAPAPEGPSFTPGLGLTPFYANRFHLWTNEHVMRFVIGDSVAGPDVDFKLMFVMTRSDAAELAKVITELLVQTDPSKSTS